MRLVLKAGNILTARYRHPVVPYVWIYLVWNYRRAYVYRRRTCDSRYGHFNRCVNDLADYIPGYPEPSRRGRMLGLWVFMRSAAPVIGGMQATI